MKKYCPNIAGIVLGLLFIMSAVMVLFHLVKMPPPPEGSNMAMFFAAFGPTGYMTFVKIFELTGGILVTIPRLRNLGLLLLGPVIVNIIAFHLFVAANPKGLIDPILSPIIMLALYLLWVGRKNFAGLLN
jgi:hypothetical protein